MSSGESITLFGTKTYRQSEHKVMGRESKIFASESLGKIMNGVTLISIFDTDSKIIQPSEESYPSPVKYCYLVGTVI